MAKYQFRLDEVTIGDVAALHHESISIRLAAVHRLTIGGIFHLPAAELSVVLNEMSDAMKAKDEEQRQNNDIRDMLNGIDGL